MLPPPVFLERPCWRVNYLQAGPSPFWVFEFCVMPLLVMIAHAVVDLA